MQQGALVVIAAGASASLVLPLYLTELRETQREIVVLLTRSAERFVPREVVGWLADEVITSDSPTLNPIELALAKLKALLRKAARTNQRGSRGQDQPAP